MSSADMIPTPPTHTPQAGAMVRADLTGTSVERSAEQNTAALVASAQARAQARFALAIRFPRDWMQVRIDLLKACERPGFAGSEEEDRRAIKDRKPQRKGKAWFVKPIGDGVTGFSIRFAEEAARCMGNLDIQQAIVYEDEQRRVLEVVVLDLQKNLSYPSTISIEKTKEQRIKPHQVGKVPGALRYRKNSYGDDLAIVPATDDEVLVRQSALASKAIRNGILRLVPGDILAECEARILAIRFGDAATDPQKVAREVADAFAALNVKPSDLAQLLDHELESCSPAELQSLRGLYKEIKDGNTTWKTALDATLRERNGEPSGPDPLAEKLKAATAAHAASAEPSAEEQKAIREREIAEAKQGREPGEDDGDEPAKGQATLPGAEKPATGRRGVR